MKSALIVSLMLFQYSSRAQTDTIKYQLSPITITATRLTESWIEVPLSVSILPINGNFQGKGYGLDEALSGVPGVLVQSRFGNQDVRLTIRGFGARGAGERSNAGTSRGVRILNNGFPETEPDGRTSFDLIDLSTVGTIEVVRSNASSMWGNASGGVVNISSYTTFEQPYMNYRSYFGSFGFRKEIFKAGAKLGRGKLYFSLSNINYKGWRNHSKSSQALFSAGIVTPLDEGTSLAVHITGTSNIFRIPGPLTEAQYNADPKQAQDDTLIYKPTYVQRDERRFNRLGRIGVTLSRNLNESNTIEASFFAQPKYLQRSERNTFRDFNRYHIGGNTLYRNKISFTPTIKYTLLIGMEDAYQDGAILFYKLNNGMRSDVLTTDKREGGNNFGFFIQNELSLNEAWLGLLGVRYDNITYYSENFLNLKLHGTKSFKQITPKFGITYRFSPLHSIYANFGGGIEVPAGNETDPPSTFGQDTIYSLNPLLEPIRSITMEIGTKQILSFGRDEEIANLMYDVALYRLNVWNDIIPYRGGRFYFTAGKSERIGAEISINLKFSMGLSLNSAFTISRNRYKEYAVDSVHYSLSKEGIFADYSNHKIVGIPDYFYEIGLKYMLCQLRGVYARVNIQGVGKYFADDANQILVPSYTILNASIGIDQFQFANDRLFINAFFGVNNLTNEKYIGSVWLNPDSPKINGFPTPAYIEPGLTRNFVGSIGIGLTF